MQYERLDREIFSRTFREVPNRGLFKTLSDGTLYIKIKEIQLKTGEFFNSIVLATSEDSRFAINTGEIVNVPANTAVATVEVIQLMKVREK